MGKKGSRGGLKTCCAVTGTVLVVAVIVMTTLAFTVFKPRDPRIAANPTNIGDIIGSLENGTSNVPMEMLVTIDNPNYGGFRFQNSTAYVHFQGDTLAEVPLVQNYVPPRSKINVTASAVLTVVELFNNPAFWTELTDGKLLLKSNAYLDGKVDVLKVFKFGATAVSTCDVIVLVKNATVRTKCKSKIKF